MMILAKLEKAEEILETTLYMKWKVYMKRTR